MMMKWWRPSPPPPSILSKEFAVNLTLHTLIQHVQQQKLQEIEAGRRVRAEVRWNGGGSPKRRMMAPLRRRRSPVKINSTRVVVLGGEDWDEHFFTICHLLFHRDDKGTAFHPYELAFTVFLEMIDGERNKSSVLGTTSLNLAEFAFAAEKGETDIQLPLSLAGVNEDQLLSLSLTISFSGLETTEEFPEIMQRPAISVPLSTTSRDPCNAEKDEFSALKASLQKVKILREIVSPRKSKKLSQEDESSEGQSSSRSDNANSSPFDVDSIDDLDEGELEDDQEAGSIRKSFNYDSLASANYMCRSMCTGMRMDEGCEAWIYYSHRRSDVGCLHADETTDTPTAVILKRSILPWEKRKTGFKSPRSKEESLLKDYGEEGGDDIDFDRRQMTSSNGSSGVPGDENVTNTSISEFGDDNFEVGKWEMKKIVSRDGHMKLSTQVFFASIDQRSERAAGESACTALVVVVAEWLQAYQGMMPIKSEFDRLIREGSSEWRNLCKNETYQACFPDKHFDLETILEGNVHSLSVVPEKSFIGFFHPDIVDNDTNHFDFLHGAMSFDKIWDEISRVSMKSSLDGNPQVYIVCWNDHFFILKVEQEAYYIVDTLGERLYEGCQQGYILKFDKETTIEKMPVETTGPTTGEAIESGNCREQQSNKQGPQLREANANGDDEVNCICKGKESCKEYIKSFLAALPIRERLVELKKGLMPSTPIHQLLQIDFHYTKQSMHTMTPLLPEISQGPIRPAVDIMAGCS